MQTILHISKMRVGDEVAVRQAHEAFPYSRLEAGIGVDRLVAFIGSGYYALELTVSDGDFQENLHRFLGDADVQRLFGALRPHVESLPEPTATTAEMPLATAMLLWQAGGVIDATSV
jgi:hypothetical protein